MLFAILILIFTVSFVGTLIARKIAINRQIIDIPNIRSSHTHPTPRGGGIAVAFAWFLGISLLLILDKIPLHLYLSLLCGIPITIIGLIDDIFTISPRVRLIGQFLCTSFALILLGGIHSVDLGFTLLNAPIIFNLLTVIGIIWLINLFNFLDGIDGYISVETIFISVSVYFALGVELPLVLAAAVAGFLIWNWQPARIFLGDAGSTLLGFTIGILAIYYQNMNQSSVLIWVMITSLFWFDATLTLFRRWRNHEQLSVAHKKHAYQRIVQSGFSHQKTVLLSLAVNLPIFGLVMLARIIPSLLLPLLIINVIYLYAVMRTVDKRFPFTNF